MSEASDRDAAPKSPTPVNAVTEAAAGSDAGAGAGAGAESSSSGDPAEDFANKPSRKQSDLALRLATAAVLIPLVLWIIAVGGWLFVLTVVTFGLIAQFVDVLSGLGDGPAPPLRLRLPSHSLDELRIQRLKRILRDHPGDSVVQIDIGNGQIVRLADEFRVDLDRAVGELRMAFGHDGVEL